MPKHIPKSLEEVNASVDTQKKGFFRRLLAFMEPAHLGFGSPKTAIPKAVEVFDADLLVLGTHGHRFVKGQPFGTTVDSARHNVGIPVFIVWEEG